MRAKLLPCLLLLLARSLFFCEEVLAEGNPKEVAAEMDPASIERAKALFLAARDLFKQGKYADALVVFESSYATYPRPSTLLNMGLCDEQLGQLVRAKARFEAVLTQLPAEDDQAKLAKEHAALVSSRLAHLTIDLLQRSDVSSLVFLDGEKLVGPKLRQSHDLDPGAHSVVVKAEGHEEASFQVDLREGEQRRLRVGPGPALGSERVDRSSPEKPSSLPTLALGAGAVGLVGLGVGGVFGVLTLNKKADLEAACPNASACDERGLALVDEGKTLGAVSTVGFAVGGLFAAAGVTLWLLNEPDPKAPSTSFGLQVRADADGGGAQLAGSF